MAHFSEMEFLFINTPGKKTPATNTIDNTVGDNERSIYALNTTSTQHYYVYKGREGIREKGVDSTGLRNERLLGNHKTKEIKNYTKTTVYEKGSNNPYVDLINNFNGTNSSKSLLIKPSDLAYLRELGVYPINRMVILRRFDEGSAIPEKLDELNSAPISTVIGWLKEEDSFGKIGFNENWTTTQKRLDELLGDMIKENFAKGSNLKSIMPVPSFARGILFGLMRQMGITGGEDSPWNWNNIPIGNPNVLQEGPYRDPSTQNIKSDMQYSFETTYEQKFIGDVDPGAAMIDIIDNLLKMGTSDMKYWLNGESGIIQSAKSGIMKDDINYWWLLVKRAVTGLGELIKKSISALKAATGEAVDKLQELSPGEIMEQGKNLLRETLKTVMTATIAKYRWELKGSIEMMTGRDSSTPWYLTVGNPYTPWLATNHIIVNKVDIETSNEVGFNDMPMWLKATISCSQSRNLGRNEIIRMFNNSFLRDYSKYDKNPMGDNIKPFDQATPLTSENNPNNVGTESSTEKRQMLNIPNVDTQSQINSLTTSLNKLR